MSSVSLIEVEIHFTMFSPFNMNFKRLKGVNCMSDGWKLKFCGKHVVYRGRNIML